MKEYKITHREYLVGWYYVDAENEEARRKYNRMVSEGKIDFSDMELIDSSDDVEEDDE